MIQKQLILLATILSAKAVADVPKLVRLKTIVLADTECGKHRQNLVSLSVDPVTVSDFFSLTAPGVLTKWSTKSEKFLWQRQVLAQDKARGFDLSDDGTLGAVVGFGPTIKILDMKDGSPLERTYQFPPASKTTRIAPALNAVAWAVSGDIFATGNFAGDLVLWNVNESKPLAVFPSVKEAIKGISFVSQDQFILFYTKEDIFIANIESREVVFRLTEKFPNSLYIKKAQMPFRDNNLMLVNNYYSSFIFNVEERQAEKLYDRSPRAILAAHQKGGLLDSSEVASVILADDNTMLRASAAGTFEIIDLDTGIPRHFYNDESLVSDLRPGDKVRTAQFSHFATFPDDQELILAGTHRNVIDMKRFCENEKVSIVLYRLPRD